MPVTLAKSLAQKQHRILMLKLQPHWDLDPFAPSYYQEDYTSVREDIRQMLFEDTVPRFPHRGQPLYRGGAGGHV